MLPTFRKSIEVINKNGTVYINPQARVKGGLRISTDPVFILPWNELTKLEKFDYIKKAFEHSIEGVEMPSNINDFSKERLEKYGVKNWGQLLKGAKQCNITLLEAEYKFTPMRYDGKGSEGIKAWIKIIPINASSEEIVKMLEKCLDQSIEPYFEEDLPPRSP